MAEWTRSIAGMVKQIKNRLPELFVIFFCMLLLGVGVSQKEGFHMDELLSFELANAEFNPWIVPTQPQGRLAKFVHNEIKGDTFGETIHNLADTAVDVLKNRGNSKLLSYQADVYQEPVWITEAQFRDYITVDDDAFHYLSVYFNVKDDNHPPVHFMMLHTISSLFRGEASPWMGCVINMLCVAVCMVLLMKLGKLLLPVFEGWGSNGAAVSGHTCEQLGRGVGILAALLYGCSTGALATTLLIRMYGMLTCFCVALFYLHVKKWIRAEFDVRNKGLIAVTVLGFLTQYFFLFYCLILAAVTVLLLWCKGRRRELWYYIRSMFTAGVIGVGIFPFSIGDVFSSGRGVEALGNLASGFAGYGARLGSFVAILADRTFGGLLTVLLAVTAVVLVGVAVIAHSRERRRALQQMSAVDAREIRSHGHIGNDGQMKQACGNGTALAVMLVVPVVGYFLLAARMSPYLVDRYIMPLFPFVTLWGTLILAGLALYLGKGGAHDVQEDKSRKVIYLLCLMVIALQLWGVYRYDGTYLYRGYANQEQLSVEYAEYPCICVYDGVGYYENLPEFTHYRKTLLVTEEELENRKDTEAIASLQEVVVLIKPSVNQQNVFRILEEKYGLTVKENLLKDGELGDRLLLFSKAQKE